MSAYLVPQQPVSPAPSTALTVPKSTALALTTSGKELLEVRKLAQTGESKFALVTQKRGGFYGNPPLERVAGWLENSAEVTKKEGPANYAGISAVIGGITGAAAYMGFDLLLVPAIAWGASVFALGLGGIGLSFGIKRLAQREKERAAENLVPLAAIEDMTKRFAEAPAGEKAALGRVLTDWLSRMNANQALAPEAMDALKQVEAETKQLPQDTVARAATLGALAELLEAKDTVESYTVTRMSQLIAQLPQADRFDVAQTLKQELEASGRKIAYQAKHDLFQMVKSNAP